MLCNTQVAQGSTRDEAEAHSIFTSLSAVGDTIAAVTLGSNQIPYTNPLTRLMSDCLGGNAKTLVFVNASPADCDVAETNNSLGFASRCKDLTAAVSTGGPGVQAAQMGALKKELAKLKKSGGAQPYGKSVKGPGPPGGLARPTTSHANNDH